MDILPTAKLLDLSGKVAIVTGGAMGIGYGVAIRLAQTRAKVMIADLDLNAAAKTAEEIESHGFAAKAVKVDVSSEEDVGAMFAKTVETFESVDILVNDAGIYPTVAVENMTSSDFDKVIAVNLRGVFLCVKYGSEQMIIQKKGGRIINITSIDALHPSSVGLAHYDASKHGVWGFTKNVALELAPHKIWVNAIAPGGIATPGVAKLQKGTQTAVDMEKMLEGFLAKIPMHRMGEPDDIGKVALFLASDMASYMTGTQVVVDGGVLLS